MYSFLFRLDLKPGGGEARGEAQRMVCVATWVTRARECSLHSCRLNTLHFKYFVLDEMDLSVKISIKTTVIARRIAAERRMKGGAMW